MLSYSKKYKYDYNEDMKMKKLVVYEFYAELRDFKPTIWRKFRVYSKVTVAKLAYIILTLFEMKASHLFKVIVPTGELLMAELRKKEGKDFYSESFEKEHPDVHQIRYSYELLDLIDHDFIPNNLNIMIYNATKTKLSHAVSMISEKLQLWYDFGDDWMIDIRLENIIEQSDFENILLPEVIDGESFGIIEDCGGIWGLADIVKAFHNKKSKAYKEYSDWLGINQFNITSFNINEMNDRLQKIPHIYKRSYEEKKTPTKLEIDIIERRK
jgi:hypothetical protein